MTRQGIATIKRRSKDRPEKNRYRSSSATAVIGGIAVLLVIFIFTSTLVRIAVDQREARDRAVAASIELSKTFAAHVAKNLHDADTIARWVEYEYEKAPRSFTLSDYKNRGLISGDTVVQVTIVGKDGNVLQTTTPAIEAINLNDRPHFLIHANNRDAGLYISKPVIGRVSGKWTLQLTRRLDNPDGSFAGIVVVSESPNFLTDGFYGAGTLAPGTLLSVISDYGYLISRRTGSASSSHEGPSVSAYSDMIGSNGGVFTDPVDGVRRFVTYHHLAQYPVSVIVGLSERDELASSEHWKVFYLGLASFISLLILIVAVFVILMLARLKAAAETDSLTGLSNRYLLTETLRRRMHALGPSGQLAMIYIDLDNFKRVNDALGHKKGDELLLQVSYRLKDAVGKERLIARIGGDEFVILVESTDAVRKAQALCRVIIKAFERPFVIRANSYLICLSIGITAYDKADDNEFDLLTQADLAMYSAKEQGKAEDLSHQCTYTPELSQRALQDIERHQEFQYAIINREFFLDYQPIVGLDRQLRGVEALVRWRHPKKGVLPPADFLSFAETSGFIVQIGEFVLEQACQDFQAWQSYDPRPLSLTINLSPVQFAIGAISRTVARCLNEYMIEPDRLHLDVSETLLHDENVTVKSELEALRKTGVKVVLDDFGSGRSSLSCLGNAAIDGIKIDWRLMQQVPSENEASEMLAHLIDLVRARGLSVVIERVETREQVAWLARFGDMTVQGFYFSRPVSAAMLPIATRA
ncbi:bifunctional diguanylate cyclase/phosphodiesterase [Robbsia andropogonis]|nr:EAL domain-containing protein [Robbsia andropogonis]